MSNSSFDPNKLSTRQARAPEAKGLLPTRLFVNVSSYDLPADDFHFAVGTVLGTGEPVRVRLTTVAERQADKPKISPEKIQGQYVTDSMHRDTIGDKAKASIRLMSFDDAIPLGANAAGVAEFRAHWPKVMSTTQTAEVMSGLAHIKLADAYEPTNGGKRVKAKSYVELLQASTQLKRENAEDVLFKALRITDDNGRARDPLAIVRVFHDGKQHAAVRIYPEREVVQKFDQGLGGKKDVNVKCDADKTIAALLNGTEGFSPDYTKAQDIVRAVLAGVKGEGEPVLASKDEAVRDQVMNLYYGAADGALTVEVIAAEKIDFGLDSGKTYLSDKGRPHLKAYNIEETGANDMIKRYVGYTDTVLAVERHPDGEPYAVFASPVALWPQNSMIKLAQLPLDTLPQLELPAEAALAAINNTAAPAPVAAEREPALSVEDGQRYSADDDGPGMP